LKALPFSPLSPTIALPMQAGTRMQETLMSSLEQWKASAMQWDIPFYKPTVEEATDEISQTSNLYSAFSAACNALMQRSTILDQFKNSSFPAWVIPKTSTQIFLSWTKQRLSELSCIPISIFLGIPGSDVISLSNAIIDISAASNRYFT